MHTCYDQWSSHPSGAALDHCDDAKPFAYGSYALFGVAGAAAVVSATLLLWRPGDTTAAPEAPEVALAPGLLPGGAALVASGRF
jgi:hypothetical protein